MENTLFNICIDVGGTFTDCLVMDAAGTLRQFKSPTTYPDPSVGFMASLQKAADGYDTPLTDLLADVDLLIHGTTLATNTLINRNGAKTGMITTKGFRDVVEIRRGYKNIRTSMYNVFVPPYDPLIPRHMRKEAEERLLFDGSVHTELNEDDVRQAAIELKEKGVESLAICFLHSYSNNDHEQRAAKIAREVMGDDVYITTSADILSVWREWERFSTTSVSAYTGPEVKSYMESLVKRLDENKFGGTLLMMLSDGLVETVEYCKPRVVNLIGSGPAAAPAAAVYMGNAAGHKNLLSFDMGGTSIDIGLIQDGRIPTTTDAWVQDERVAIKMVDVKSAGAGGGSIAWIDSLGLLRVGPQSAGSTPGPACYGNGGEDPTVTDLDIALGYMDPDFFLGGEIKLDPDLSRQAIQNKIGEPLGMNVDDAAQAAMATVVSYMADQITEISTTVGFDVRDMAIVAGGGAGPMHAPFIAERLGVPNVIVPTVAATYSAFGMFAMDVGRNYARSYIVRAVDLDIDRVNQHYKDMQEEASDGFLSLGVKPEDGVFQRTAEVRYIGQYHEVEVDVAEGDLTAEDIEKAIDQFHDRHKELYTFNMHWKGVEFLTFRVRATAPKKPIHMQSTATGGPDASAAVKGHRQAWFDGEKLNTPVYDGSKLTAGNLIQGPAIIEEPTTTVLVPVSYKCTVDNLNGYQLELKSKQQNQVLGAAAGAEQ
jgi:N-methylhydantoinase A